MNGIFYACTYSGTIFIGYVYQNLKYEQLFDQQFVAFYYH